MAIDRLELLILGDPLAVCRLGPAEEVPPWAFIGGFCNMTRTLNELSVVCLESLVPDGVRSEKSWYALRVSGVLDFSLVGVLAGLVVTLAEAGIAVFSISTFDTDYLLVKDHELGRAIEALTARGHSVSWDPRS